jgi:flavin-dependent dehydrogenase
MDFMFDTDYVVVGAGTAGLTAAYELKKKGASVLVLEARVESLRGRMGESTRGVENLFESLLAESFGA